MPVDYLRVDAIAAAVADIYAEGEQALLAAVTRQLAAGGFDDDTPVWARRKLGELRALQRAAVLIVDRLQSDGGTVIRRAVADGMRAGSTAGIADLADTLVGDPGPAARAAQPNAAVVEALADATVAEIRPTYSAVLRSTSDAYRHAVAGATARHATLPSLTTRQAAQQAWAALAAKGISGFTDKTGRRWRLHTYVEMATRTAVARAAIVAQTDIWTAAGVRDVYVVDNPRECPLCAKWETQVLAISPFGPVVAPAIATLAQAQAQGLNHPNCRHALRPWTPGTRIVAARRPEGPEGYEAEQQQRAIERKLRAWRERYAAAFDDSGRQHAATRIHAWAEALQQHLDTHPRLPRLSYREKPGAGYRAPRSTRTARDRAHLKTR